MIFTACYVYTAPRLSANIFTHSILEKYLGDRVLMESHYIGPRYNGVAVYMYK